MCWETFTEEAVFPNVAQIQILSQRHWEGRDEADEVTETKNGFIDLRAGEYKTSTQ